MMGKGDSLRPGALRQKTYDMEVKLWESDTEASEGGEFSAIHTNDVVHP